MGDAVAVRLAVARGEVVGETLSEDEGAATDLDGWECSFVPGAVREQVAGADGNRDNESLISPAISALGGRGVDPWEIQSISPVTSPAGAPGTCSCV